MRAALPDAETADRAFSDRASSFDCVSSSEAKRDEIPDERRLGQSTFRTAVTGASATVAALPSTVHSSSAATVAGSALPTTLA